MAKDPAINWYFDNWDGGTKLLTRHQKGCYMDLLSAQFHCGRLTVENIKTILGPDFSEWDKCLKAKFDADEKGMFFSGRLEHEILKKKRFLEKQMENGQKGGRPKKPKQNPNNNPNHNPNESLYGTGTEIENVFEEKGVQGEKQNLQQSANGNFPFPNSEIIGELPPIKIQKTIEQLKIQTQQDVDIGTVVQMWGIFKVQNCTGKKYYPDVGDVESHFMNWILKKNFSKNGTGKTRQERTNDSLTRLAQRGAEAVERLRAKVS